MRHPLVKLPIKVESALLLIREELKTRSFFNRLEEVGFLGDNVQSNLHALIADNLGIDIEKDEDFEKFDRFLDETSEEVGPDLENDDLMMIVLRVYTHLMSTENTERVNND